MIYLYDKWWNYLCIIIILFIRFFISSTLLKFYLDILRAMLQGKHKLFINISLSLVTFWDEQALWWSYFCMVSSLIYFQGKRTYFLFLYWWDFKTFIITTFSDKVVLVPSSGLLPVVAQFYWYFVLRRDSISHQLHSIFYQLCHSPSNDYCALLLYIVTWIEPGTSWTVVKNTTELKGIPY